VQRHICSDPGNSPQVTSFCVFQCLVWQLGRSEVMGRRVVLVWVNTTERPIFKKGKKGLGLQRLCTGWCLDEVLKS
jgi:hypothetical protein